jgi:IMP dehydrogenase/GMP reductase
LDKALSFDDVLLVPMRSDIYSRKDISISTELFSGYSLRIPIISANMPSVTGPKLAVKMWNLGGLSILHRFNTVYEAVREYSFVKSYGAFCGVSLGVGDDTDERMDRLYEAGARFFCLDVAHGHHDRVVEKLNKYKSMYPGVSFIAGNVATYLGCYDLAEAGADAIKIGIGPGAACTTREVTGFGVPQVSAIMECSLVKKDFPEVRLIADGGIKNSGDIVKALAFGADSVMVGRLLAGVDEAPFPGEYFGNASSKVRDYRAPEGVHGTIERSGNLEDVIKNLTWGIKSGLSYAGCNSIYDLHETDIDYVITSSQSMLETRTRI